MSTLPKRADARNKDSRLIDGAPTLWIEHLSTRNRAARSIAARFGLPITVASAVVDNAGLGGAR